jgi:gas vesicle protein
MKNGTKNTLLAFLAGATAGAIAGILLAPDKGVNTRNEISKTAKNVSKEVSETLHEKVEELKEQVNKVVADVLERVKDVGEKVSKTGEKVTEVGKQTEKVADSGVKNMGTSNPGGTGDKIYGQ